MLKKSKLFYLIFTLVLCIVVAGIVIGIFAPQLLFAKRCPDGWQYVCCGPQCYPPGDYCIGTGTYCCCK